MSQNNHNGQARAEHTSGGTGELSFIIESLIGRIQTVTLVRVMAVKNSGLAPVGLVDVQPMVAQLDGAGNAVAHGTIHNIPYFRLQGGSNAVIIDPQVGDIGMCGFCSRDISSVKNNKTPSAPQSRRRFDWSDGLYFGGFLNGTPEQYIMFMPDGIKLFSPSQIELSAPNIQINGNTTLNGNTTQNGSFSQIGGGKASFSGKIDAEGDIDLKGTLTSDTDVIADGKSLKKHTNGGMGVD